MLILFEGVTQCCTVTISNFPIPSCKTVVNAILLLQGKYLTLFIVTTYTGKDLSRKTITSPFVNGSLAIL